MTIKYKTYIKSKEWNDKKIEIKTIKWNICQRCWSKNNIHVHHASYKKLWNEPAEHLFILCWECHEQFHCKYKMWKSMINKTMNFIYWKWWRKKIYILQ